MEVLTKIKVPTREEVDSTSQGIFDTLKSKLGTVPNLYATIGYSSDALSGILGYSEAAGKGTFTNKEIEAIKLAVSEANNCAYCKAAHTALGQMNGFTEDETIQLRARTINNARLKALTTIAFEIAAKAGHVSDEVKENFFAQGFDEKALIDLVAVVTAVTFTNYAYGVSQIPVDFPPAKNI
ncbi:carboxymuconolactone decarboxylase family protein [Jiulongibacter sp. NS-SX5]|uniref:carboxymuconolactone decarboxylase family protein n=1 Tax=Jiulongibacter sp. NS-SX5 TaxID=3463854 RepID=UPI00405902CD